MTSTTARSSTRATVPRGPTPFDRELVTVAPARLRRLAAPLCLLLLVLVD